LQLSPVSFDLLFPLFFRLISYACNQLKTPDRRWLSFTSKNNACSKKKRAKVAWFCNCHLFLFLIAFFLVSFFGFCSLFLFLCDAAPCLYIRFPVTLSSCSLLCNGLSFPLMRSMIYLSSQLLLVCQQSTQRKSAVWFWRCV
jgi:small-conductance mechanosensitive channel